MSGAIHRVVITFGADGISYAISYLHTEEPPTPGTKQRLTRAARMASAALEAALEGLDKGSAIWGGFATDMRSSTDMIVAEREEKAS